MAKQQEAAEKELPGKGTAVAKAGVAGLPADMLEKMELDAGKGVSTAAEDNLVPMIAILQDKSPQVVKKDPKYIEGCESGMIWLKGATTEFVPGEEGILVQSCFFYRNFVEWVPREKGGGWIGVMDKVPAEAKEVVDPTNKNKIKWVMPNGNEIIDTRYHVVRVIMDDGSRPQYVIPFSSTGHTVSRGWMTMMNSFKLKSGKPAPSYARLYRLKLKYKVKNNNSWWMFEPKDEGWVGSVEEYEAGLVLNTAFERQEKTADMSGMNDTGVNEPTDQGGM